MLFSSTIFLFFFFPAVFLVYYGLSFSRLMQNIWLFLMSLLFYAWGKPVNVLLLLGSIVVNWLAGVLLGAAKKPRIRKAILVAACIVNLGVLGAFKYTGFVVEFINSLFPQNVLTPASIALPIGISFFTFQALSYVIDVYKGTAAAEKNPFYVGLYISFFPQLIAGPIVRYNSIAEQIRSRKSSLKKISVGCCRFLVGLGKKVILANNLAILADLVFGWSELGTARMDLPVLTAWMGLAAYTLQIYFDFSGYSDMAIGLGLMFGFQFEENFDYPYAASSVTDFWRRWHISLTSWFREYVYFPLGGSRVTNKDIMVRNLFVVWLLTGIWHGAGWTFIFWGLWHFLFQLAERFFGYADGSRNKGWMHLYTILEVSIGWVFFRAKDLYQASVYLKNLVGLGGNSFLNDMTGFLLHEYWIFLVLGAVLSLPVAKKVNTYLVNPRSGKLGAMASWLYPAAMFALYLVCVSYIVRGSYNPFIYFNF